MMRDWWGPSLWVLFVALAALISQLALRACELGAAPLFGFSYCALAATGDNLDFERRREERLRTAIHGEEMRIAALPRCIACIPRAASPPTLAVIVDHSPSMNLPL